MTVGTDTAESFLTNGAPIMGVESDSAWRMLDSLDAPGSVTALVADDDPAARDDLSYALESAGCRVVVAGDAAEVLEKLDGVSVAVLDVDMKRLGGASLVARVKEKYPDLVVILMSVRPTIDEAVAAIRQGAYHYLPKPVESLDLLIAVHQAVHAGRLERANRLLRSAAGSLPPVVSLRARTSAGVELSRQVRRVAQVDSTVLLIGGSGTGKSTLAHWVHELGPRRGEPFVTVSCSSLPRELIEAELFGHAPGAIAAAAAERMGRVEMADGGTLLLDEVGDLPLELQPKLLRFLQDREFQRVGCTEQRRVNARLIATTNRDLRKMCDERLFREDLFYRLSVLPIQVPSLAERRTDIPELARDLLERLSRRRQSPGLELSDEALQTLMDHDWPGNIRELENVLERAAVLSDRGRIEPGDLALVRSSGTRRASDGPEPWAGLSLAEIERRALQATLQTNGGNKARAARQLGVSEKTVYNMIRRYGLA
jgi:DNA-binding NtrC family response regulator